MEKKLSVIGLGYIGLPTAIMFAANGVKVIGTDNNPDLVDTLHSGELTFEEKGLGKLFFESLQNGIEFTTEFQSADVYIVAVPTPYIKSTKKIDPSYVVNAVKSVLAIAPKGAILIIESTISPGTIDQYIRPLILEMGLSAGEDIHLAHAPERILPGNMIYELEHNSRTIGADDPVICEEIRDLYAHFCKAEIVLTDIRTAEMTKVIENTYRDINIAFANELARICNRANLDVYKIIQIANKHPRVKILQPGPGVGGHCISVDPWFLVGDYPDLVNIVLSARQVNENMPDYILSRIRAIMEENGITDIGKVGLYGLTYKEDIDDVRESPTLQLLEKMANHLAFGIKVYDPLINKKIVENQYLDFDEFLEEMDLLVILVAHKHIKENIDKIRDKLIFDTRNAVEIEGTYRL